MLVLLLSVLLFSAISQHNCQPKVKTRLGDVQGKTIEVLNGKKLDVYLGIPFAKAPIGDLRFRHPVPAEPWEGVLNATEFGNTCMQVVIKAVKLLRGLEHLYVGDNARLSEDCLFLNVFVPNPKPSTDNVIVYIHGGSFNTMSAATDAFDVTEVAAKGDVIVVTMNYRLSALGFTYLDTPEIDGNVGLVDQVIAMKWVKDNIDSFGGDGNKITLQGVSSGAISLGMHLVSPMAKGLFHRVIMESGSGLYGVAIKPRATLIKATKTLAEYLGCKDLEDMSSIAKCLRKASAEDILSNLPMNEDDPIPYFPVIDGKYLAKLPEESFKEKKFQNVDVLIGSVKDEGTFFMMLVNPIVFNPLKDNVFPVYEDLPKAVKGIDRKVTDDELERVINLYIDKADRNSTEKIVKGAANFVGDFLCRCGSIRTAKYMMDGGNKVYSYVFNHRTKLLPLSKWFGVMHGTDVFYNLGHVRKPQYVMGFNEEDLILSDRVIKYWTNFAKTGNPNIPENTNDKDWIYWPESEKNDLKYLVLAPQNRTVLHNLHEKECEVVHEIFQVEV